MSLIQQLRYGATEDEWNSWMSALTTWAQNQDDITTGLPVTKQGVTNIMEMSGSTSNAFLLYYVSSLPAQPSFTNQVVYNGEDGRVYAWHNTLNQWLPTGATAFDQLTGFLQAGQILIGNQINICTNGCCTNDAVGRTPSGWSTNSSFSNAPVLCVAGSSSPAGCPTNNCLYIQGRDTNFVAGGGFDVKPNEVYYMESYMGSDGTTPGMNVGLYFPAVGSYGPQWIVAFGAQPGQTGWITQNGTVTVPSWANRAQVWLQVNASGSQASQYGNNWFTGVECVKSPSTMQQYRPFGTSALPSSSTATLFTGSFYAGYASIILVGLDVQNATTGGINVQLGLNIDGTQVDLASPNFTTPSGATAVPVTLFGLTTVPGNHSFTITGSSGNSSWTQSVQARNISVLNLLK